MLFRDIVNCFLSAAIQMTVWGLSYMKLAIGYEIEIMKYRTPLAMERTGRKAVSDEACCR